MPRPRNRELAPQQLSRVATSCACFSLRKATRVITQLYDDLLRPSGIRSTQLTLLALLAGHGPMRITELAEASVTDRTTLTRNLAVLEAEGLVRTSVGQDARVRLVEITPGGRERLASALPLWERAQALVAERLGETRVQRLRSDLAATVNAIGETEAG
jgi:DNA-binding MarR family transcriptional regulator